MRAAVWTGRREGVDLAPRNTLAVRIHLQHKKNKNKNEITDLFSNKKDEKKINLIYYVMMIVAQDFVGMIFITPWQWQ